MNNIDEVIKKLRKLNVDQQTIIASVIDEFDNKHKQRSHSINSGYTHGDKQQQGHPDFISSNGKTLTIGDSVTILSNAKTGKQGDIATILRFNKQYVTIRLHRNRSTTQRAASNLKLIASSQMKNRALYR